MWTWYEALVDAGVDLAICSGHKYLSGTTAGIVAGRRDLIAAVALQARGIGRPMKVGKEEIMGLLAALEQWVIRDHQAEWQEWERRLAVISEAATAFTTVETSISQPGRSNVAPHLSISWDAGQLDLSGSEVAVRLSSGEPRIELGGGEYGISINPYMMEEGDAEQVAHCLLLHISEPTRLRRISYAVFGLKKKKKKKIKKKFFSLISIN